METILSRELSPALGGGKLFNALFLQKIYGQYFRNML